MNIFNSNIPKHAVRLTAIAVVFIITGLVFLAPRILTHAVGSFKTGNIYLVSNTNNPVWADSANAQNGDIVQFKVDVVNLGNETARNVRVSATLPTNVTGNTLTSTISISADNAATVTDTATVVVSTEGNKGLVIFPGHTQLISNAGTVQLPDTITSGVSIGDVLPGESNFVEVTFKVSVVVVTITPTPTVTPTITPTISPTPTVTVTPAVTVTPTPTVSPTVTLIPTQTPMVTPPAGSINISNVNQQSQSQSQTNILESFIQFITGVTPTPIPTATPMPTPTPMVTVTPSPVPQVTQLPVTGVSGVTELPKTGLPLVAWAVAGLGPLGIGFRGFYKNNVKNRADKPQYLWQKRAFDKEE